MPNKEIKNSIREELLRKRDNIPPEVRRTKNRIIQERLSALDEFKNADVMFLFASFKTEVDTFDLIRKLLLAGKRTVLPKVDKERHMLFLYEIKNMDELSSGYMGIPEPPSPPFSKGGQGGLSEERLFSINNVDIVIIPGAGFDMSGNRIGYGAGYYDILLSGLKKNIPIIAPAYEEQIVDSIPSEPHDIKVHIIVTDMRVIKCM